MKKYGLDIDHGLCWGCRTCEVACKQEHQTPEGVQIIRLSEAWSRTEQGRVDFVYHVHVCRHCDDPPCAEVCPEEAITKREDNIVLLDEDRCSGCGLCIEACPYDAVSFDGSRGVAQKCNLCHHRIDRGLLPACADNVCLAHCIHLQQ
jgi:Fe-S-cluster-containing dehydrogenase component